MTGRWPTSLTEKRKKKEQEQGRRPNWLTNDPPGWQRTHQTDRGSTWLIEDPPSWQRTHLADRGPTWLIEDKPGCQRTHLAGRRPTWLIMGTHLADRGHNWLAEDPQGWQGTHDTGRLPTKLAEGPTGWQRTYLVGRGSVGKWGCRDNRAPGGRRRWCWGSSCSGSGAGSRRWSERACPHTICACVVPETEETRVGATLTFKDNTRAHAQLIYLQRQHACMNNLLVRFKDTARFQTHWYIWNIIYYCSWLQESKWQYFKTYIVASLPKQPMRDRDL